jgi:hypothetical protein
VGRAGVISTRVTVRPSHENLPGDVTLLSCAAARAAGAHRSRSANRRRVTRSMAREIAGGAPLVIQITGIW